MSDLSLILSDMIDELTPIHQAETTFAKGGDKCAQAIARFYDRLREAEPMAHDLEATVEFLEEEIEELKDDEPSKAENSPPNGPQP